MWTAIVCAVAVVMTLRHVLELIEQNAELAKQVLLLTFRVDRLRQLSRELMVTTDTWSVLGRRRPSARLRVAVYYRRKREVSSTAAPRAGDGAGAGDITSNTSCISSGGIIQSERRLSPLADASARFGGGSTSRSCTGSDTGSCCASNFAERRCHKQGERSCSESGSSCDSASG